MQARVQISIKKYFLFYIDIITENRNCGITLENMLKICYSAKYVKANSVNCFIFKVMDNQIKDV